LEPVFYARGQSGPVHWGFTDRQGGVSAGEFGSLNLGGHVGDDPDAVETNRTRVAEAMGVSRDRLLFLQQCHGNDVVVVDGPWGPSGAPRADGVVTATPGLALAALVADCTPVLLADPAAGVVAAVHAGRPGMTSRIVDAAVAHMQDLGAREISAVVGPSVCGRCYEVPARMRDEAAAVSPESATVSWQGTPAVDVAAGVVAQLHANSVAVQWVPGCAREDDRLYSYRRDGRTGRFAGVVALEAS
jgi:YfiH family protein